MLIELLFSNPAFFVTWLVAITIGITVHEYFHALAATLQGDATAEEQGRLTLNPLAHLDPLGTLMLVLIGFGYGRPVPFNPYNLRNKRFGPAIVGIAGPVANLLMIVVFGLVLRGFASAGWSTENLFIVLLVNLVQINVILLIFNLIPIPPLDGSKVMFALLPASMENIRTVLEQYGPWILLGILIFGQGIFRPLFNFFLDSVFQALF
ncbi:MAG: site-2 protease family protein [bacterium]|nr:site-2 protease family protein [bacterium]